MSEIKIVPVGQVDDDVEDYLAFVLSDTFGIRCECLKVDVDYRQAYDARRRQYDSTQILSELLKLSIGPGSKLLGVSNLDLFVPIFTFVFGSAQVGGRAALISTGRLSQQFYGLQNDRDLFLLRCEKEAVHELGHAFGLGHCSRYECVMHFSNSIEHVDLKGSSFCAQCLAQVTELKEGVLRTFKIPGESRSTL